MFLIMIKYLFLFIEVSLFLYHPSVCSKLVIKNMLISLFSFPGKCRNMQNFPRVNIIFIVMLHNKSLEDQLFNIYP